LLYWYKSTNTDAKGAAAALAIAYLNGGDMLPAVPLLVSPPRISRQQANDMGFPDADAVMALQLQEDAFEVLNLLALLAQKYKYLHLRSCSRRLMIAATRTTKTSSARTVSMTTMTHTVLRPGAQFTCVAIYSSAKTDAQCPRQG
jgi:hypothetical protein